LGSAESHHAAVAEYYDMEAYHEQKCEECTKAVQSELEKLAKNFNRWPFPASRLNHTPAMSAWSAAPVNRQSRNNRSAMPCLKNCSALTTEGARECFSTILSAGRTRQEIISNRTLRILREIRQSQISLSARIRLLDRFAAELFIALPIRH